jgi:hypothetical protein
VTLRRSDDISASFLPGLQGGPDLMGAMISKLWQGESLPLRMQIGKKQTVFDTL